MNTLIGGIPALLLATALPFNANAAQGASPMYLSLKHGAQHAVPGTPQLPQWNGSFIDRTGKQVNFTMVGGNPANAASTHVPVVLVPVIAVYGQDNGDKTFNPLKHKEDENGETIVQNIVNSPLFTSNINYIQGGTDLGTTQFVDAFQRGNFWSSVKENSGYHLLYDVSVLDPLKIQVTSDEGTVIKNPYGAGKVGTMDIDRFDDQLQSYISAHQASINPAAIPLFVSWNVFLASNGECCIGGYNGANGNAPGGQIYAFAAYIASKTSYAEDISAVAVELGNMTVDPFVTNQVNCANTPLLDAATTLSKKNFFPDTENDYTYTLPSFDFVTYFGAPKSTSVNKWYSFQGEVHHACEGQ